jgi:hypothetical protein
VAGVIAAVNNNGEGISSIAGGDGRANTGVRVMACQIFSGNMSTGLLNVVRAMKYAADNGAVVLQCSWGYVSGSANIYDWGEAGFATQEQWETSHSGANVLLNSAGQLCRDGMSNLLTLTTEGGARALTVWDGLGNAAGNLRAVIGETITLGNAADGSVVTIDSDSMDMMHGTDEMLHFGYGEGTSETGTANAPYYTLGVRNPYGAQTKGNYSVAEGYIVEPSGYASHAEGINTIADGPVSHAEGSSTTASGYYSHAEGVTTSAGGYAAHAEGLSSAAGGEAAHAEGEYCAALDHAHAQNLGTYAAKRSQTTMGTYNEKDTSSTTTHPSGDARYGDYALIIGNGTSDSARSNAFAVKWDGSPLIKQPAAWRSALGMARSTSSVTPQNSTWAYQYCYANAVMGMVTCNQLRVSSALANGSSVTIGTVPSGYRPPYNVYATVCSTSASAQGGLFVLIDSNGVVTLYNRSGSQLGTGTNLYFTVTYAL